MSGASIEGTLELWAASLREVKARMRPLFTQERVAASAGLFLDGLLGEERRKTATRRAAGLPGRIAMGRIPLRDSAVHDQQRGACGQHLPPDARPSGGAAPILPLQHYERVAEDFSNDN